jgi:hypothetical protein
MRGLGLVVPAQHEVERDGDLLLDRASRSVERLGLVAVQATHRAPEEADDGRVQGARARVHVAQHEVIPRGLEHVGGKGQMLEEREPFTRVGGAHRGGEYSEFQGGAIPQLGV